MMLLIETVVISCCAIVLGVLMGLALSPGLLFLVEQVFPLIELHFYFSWEALLFAAVFPLFLLVLTAVITPFLLRRQKIIQLLQSERRLDDKSEPPMGFLRSMLAVFFISTLAAICLFFPVDLGLGVHVLNIIIFLTAMGVYFFIVRVAWP